MASPIGHGLVGTGLAVVFARATGTPDTPVLWLGAALASNLPDLDLLGVAFGFSLRHTHRKASHSLLVLGSLALLALGIWDLTPAGANVGLGLAWSAALLSHPLLDVITTDPGTAARGFGIPLFWPVLTRRWYVRRPIYRTAKIKAYLTSSDVAWRSLLAEISVLGPVSLILVLGGYLL